ncbi:MAG: hypothetical protein HY547_08670 [Elusimicrobia bacterium]|nr:hypothetical protein [Elusimicrobiota bacterium]
MKPKTAKNPCAHLFKALIVIVATGLLGIPLFGGETDDADGCPEGEILVGGPAGTQGAGECRKISYEKKGRVDFDGLEIQGETVGPWGVYHFDRPKPDFPCEKELQAAADPADQAAYFACLGITPPPECPQGQMWVWGKCRNPQYLERITGHTYDRPVTNAPPSPEVAELGEKLREEYDRTKQCPQDFNNIELLKKNRNSS